MRCGKQFCINYYSSCATKTSVVNLPSKVYLAEMK